MNPESLYGFAVRNVCHEWLYVLYTYTFILREIFCILKYSRKENCIIWILQKIFFILLRFYKGMPEHSLNFTENIFYSASLL